MSTALYRRYRPETFAELIGQSQVTAPLMAALRADKVNHAYLFSGPRGCGKTTSARILARCLNCAEGPTDTPCGKCPSCIELARNGSGSLDVVEIDAASHNGVDDARDLRERAMFAPARDRYKIFILDEAHMVTAQGFNALLKIVEEPPAHVKFIFATTEPEKVIATIRSRTHHYPFRLVPPAQLLDYLEELCATEKVDIAPGVLSLVVRSGGGSVRDSLSLLDQLIAGSEDNKVTYERAVSLLGYTPDSVLDEAVEGLAVGDSALVFQSVDKIIQSGQDPRQFVEDLLERLRDLILVDSVGLEAKSVLRGISDTMLARLQEQAAKFGRAELAHAAASVSDSLSSMTGATSPKLHLELMCAKILVPAANATEVGSLARIERLERRIGIGGEVTSSIPIVAAPITENASAPVAPATTPIAIVETGITASQVRSSWQRILDQVAKKSKRAYMVAYNIDVVAVEGDVLTLRFASNYDLESFKGEAGAPDVLRNAIEAEFGIVFKFKPMMEATPEPKAAPVTAPVAVVAATVAEVAEAEPEEPEEEPVSESRNTKVNEEARYGESLLREILGAEPLDD
ncbi:MAG: DNA polymerase III subunit gamma and tau [Actinobacteria bacterium]|uniref:DNA-directed DNA polymerase n=1 Tax=freshwater metagenome TaxID=449393 RepID=A0A6J6HUS7_9ZZZZ|nr:DNA polymerase III subunit gamma and tau [Actinomycetota bacterium]